MNSLKMKNRVAWLACLGVLVFPMLGKIETVQAEIISFPATVSVPLTQTDWVDQLLTFPKFDPSLGTLTKVQIDFGGNIYWSVQGRATNPLEGGVVGFEGHIHTQFTINNPENTLTISEVGFDAGYIQGSAGPLEGCITASTNYLADLQGNIITTPDSWASPSGGIQYIDSSTLNEFSGSGDLLMMASTFSTFDISTSHPTWVEGSFNSIVSLTGTVSYYYNPIPEPATLVLLGTFFLGIGLFRFLQC